MLSIITCSLCGNAQPGVTDSEKTTNNLITGARKVNATTIDLSLSNHQHILLDFYSDHIVRVYYDPSGVPMHDPPADPPTKILVDNPRKPVAKLEIEDKGNRLCIHTGNITLTFDKKDSRLDITNNQHRTVLQTLSPIAFDKQQTILQLKEYPDEYFYGGGVQNGRFSHKGRIIAIENQNAWTDGGVASPAPFYWSTNGYGLMWYTFKKGKYDFGNKESGVVRIAHETNYLDVFFLVDAKPLGLLNDYYQLTGHPVLLPKFGFYEGHLNAYNRDYWKPDSTGIIFEDGRRYKESQKDNGGIKESLNGEKNNYQFSARAVIDRYQAHDMPLGWILPNDGYGAGYGQAGTLDSNILNLKSFGDYARQHGVQIGLWTQSDLHPKPGISALLQRDIVKEVGVAGVRVLKTDVAWVGQGYSFGLHGVAEVAHIMPEKGNHARPFIISLDGWAGTQRYAAVWSGDQTGGQWEYIRFHIPTYIGAGLSGEPNITSDMDGIFGGKNFKVNIRDFQWKAFTPMQLNMDGWGANEKYPQALGEPATSINRTYLKLKSMLIPYTYSIAKAAVDGLPIMRATFLTYPNTYTHGKATAYQYFYGPYFLVAPVYQETRADEQGNDIRNGIYLPPGDWIDYFSGDLYKGGRIINNFDAPIWKLPLFVKAGAIIPMTHPNNHVSEIRKSLRIYELYPAGQSSFTEYDDDGLTEAYKQGAGVTTRLESDLRNHTATIVVHPATGNFDGFVRNKATEFHINLTAPPARVTAKLGAAPIRLQKAISREDFESGTNLYYYDAQPDFNRFATKGSAFEKTVIIRNPQLLVKLAPVDITKTNIILTITGYHFAPADPLLQSTGELKAPTHAGVPESGRQAFTLLPSWNKVPRADYYEMLFRGELYSTIRDTSLLFTDLLPETDYTFRVRAVNKTGVSAWENITARTKINPLTFAIKDISVESSVPSQASSPITELVDFDETNLWHTRFGMKAVPFTLTMDLRSVNQLNKLEYLPRSRGNGIWLKGSVAYSMDKKNWQQAGDFAWARTGDTKEFSFPTHPTARYIRIAVTEAVGDFGSGRELYVFKVPGTESMIPGDINDDHQIDDNDLTSYLNYTGLRKGDADFEGYVSKGDINQNGLIDAYDISHVGTRLNGGVDAAVKDSLAGRLDIRADKTDCNKGEILTIHVRGIGLHSVNALSFALPYDAADFEFDGIQPKGMESMENMTNDRLHTNGSKVLYPTFVNIGEQPTLQGDTELFTIRLKARRNAHVN
ncbi:MAG TPA: TIM-barrel domain-containing protein, partial [Sediminibacterium sp.]|nr:TIM-barrel domain-containing protein [Sediminibacterium sp.]